MMTESSSSATTTAAALPHTQEETTRHNTIGKRRGRAVDHLDRRTLRRPKDDPPASPSSSLAALSSVASLPDKLSRIEQYEKSAQTLLKMDPTPEAARTLHVVGTAAQSDGAYKVAILYFERSLEMQYELHPDGESGNTEQIADTLNQLGVAYCDNGDPRGSRRCLKRALSVLRALGDVNTPKIAEMLESLGEILSMVNDHRGARRYYEESLKMRFAMHPEGARGASEGMADVLHSLGGQCMTTEDYADARKYYEQSIDMEKRLNLPRKGTRLAWTHTALGVIAARERRYKDSCAHTAGALTIRDSLYPEEVFHSEILINAQHMYNILIEAASSYEEISEFVTDRYRRLLVGSQTHSRKPLAEKARALAEWRGRVQHVKRDERDIRRKHRHRMKLEARKEEAHRRRLMTERSRAAARAEAAAESERGGSKTKTKTKTKKKKKKKRK